MLRKIARGVWRFASDPVVGLTAIVVALAYYLEALP
jgi:hypothetical protein